MRRGLEENSNIVQEFKLGNASIKFADNYCRDKTQEDIDAILERIAKIALKHYRAADIEV